MSEAIFNHRVAGTRITVWDVLHYHEHGWTEQEIAGVLKLSLDQVQAAVKYIQDHRDEVLAGPRQIEDRIAKGNPAEIEARRAENRAKLQQWKQQQQVGVRDRAGHRGGR